MNYGVFSADLARQSRMLMAKLLVLMSVTQTHGLFTDFMQQLDYNDPAKYVLCWLLPGNDLDTWLCIVDCDTDTSSMIAVVPKF
jgi:hypothetical protein